MSAWSTVRRILVCSLAATLASAGIIAAALPSEAAVDTQTFVTMYSTTGDSIGQGNNYAYSEPVDDIGGNVMTAENDMIEMIVDGANGDWFFLTFASVRGEPLAVGTYTNATRASFRDDVSPGIDVAGDGRGCNKAFGEFTVRDIEFSGTDLTKLSLSFVQHCEFKNSPPIFGEVVFGEDALAAPAHVVPWNVDWPSQELGASGKTVPVRVTAGSSSMQLSNIQVAADSVPADSVDFPFTIDSETCAGALLAAGSSCKIMLTFTPDVIGDYAGTLVIGGDISANIALSGDVVGATDWHQVTTNASGSQDPTKEVQFGWQSTFHATGDATAVTVTGRSWDHHVNATFAAPQGETLTAGGTYLAAQLYPNQDASHAGFALAFDGHNCSESYSSFQIDEIEFDPGTGAVTRFAGRYQHNCGTGLDDVAHLGAVAFDAQGGLPTVPDFGQFDGSGPSQLSVHVTPTETNYGRRLDVSGALRDQYQKTAAGQDVALYQLSAVSTHWRLVGNDLTNADGAFLFHHTARTNAKYRVEFAGNPLMAPKTSAAAPSKVHRVVVAHLSDSRIHVDRPTHLYGHIESREQGIRVDALVRDPQGHWVSFITDTTNRQGGFDWRITAHVSGTFRIRVVCEETVRLKSGLSSTATLHARG
ncbi:MAG TPA: hypothetical protein VMT88_03265 [Actinomycetes bacterium]|nr:hypothetical protein [Actinomycetes bacterium]